VPSVLILLLNSSKVGIFTTKFCIFGEKKSTKDFRRCNCFPMLLSVIYTHSEWEFFVYSAKSVFLLMKVISLVLSGCVFICWISDFTTTFGQVLTVSFAGVGGGSGTV